MDIFLGHERFSYQDISSIYDDWKPASNEFISWKKVWDLDNLPNFQSEPEDTFAGGFNGSLIARYRNPYSIYDTKSIQLYDYKGNLIYDYQIKTDANNLYFHVTQSDKLIVLTSNGKLLTYFAGRNVDEKLFADDNIEIFHACIWDTGFIYFTRSFDIYYAPFFGQPQFFRNFEDTGQIPVIVRVIPPEYTANKSPIIFLSDNTNKITIITKDDHWQVTFDGDVCFFEISPNFSTVAIICLIDSTFVLIVTAINLTTQHITRYLPSKEGRFLQMRWVGSDSVVITYEDSVNIVLFDDIVEMDKEQYPFSGLSWVFTSTDYALIFSSGTLFKLNLVSEKLSQTIRPKPDTPPSKLIDAFIKRSAEHVMQMKNSDELENAMQTLLESAQEVDSISEQRILMLSANFARTYLSLSNHYQIFTETAQKIRISNTLQTDLCVLISPHYLYSEITQTDLLYRICNRHRFSMALKIADFLSFDKRSIVTEWCLAITDNSDCDNALRFIKSNFAQNTDIFDICQIASCLYHEGRTTFAKKVAELEPSAMRIVPFYTHMNMWEEAILAANKSCDSSLFINVFNQAVDNGLFSLISPIVGNDYVMFSTVAKMISQERLVSLLTIYNENPKSLILSARDRAYFDIIINYRSNFVPENVVNFQSTLIKSVGDFENNVQTLATGQSKNKAIEQMILNLDLSNTSTVQHFIQRLKGKQSKYYIMIGSVLAKHPHLKPKFAYLADTHFKQYWYHYLMMILYNFGYEDALIFIKKIPIPDEAAKMENIINCKNKIEQQKLLNEGKDFTLFAPKFTYF